MTDNNQLPDERNVVRPPQDTDTGYIAPADTASDDPTVEAPTIPTPTIPTPPPTAATSFPATPQPTAVMPQVPPPVDRSSSGAGVEWDVSGNPDDTAETTLTEITLSDAEGGSLMAWMGNMKTKLTTRRGSKSGPSRTKSSRTKRWRLRPWQWAVIGVGALVLVFALFVIVDGGLYYGKVHHGVNVAGEDLSRMTSIQAAQALTSLVDEAQQQPITLQSDSQTWTVLPTDLGATIDVAAAVSKAMAVTREGNVFTDLGKKIALYFSTEDLPLEGAVDDSKIDQLLTMLSGALDVPAVNATLRVVDGSVEVMDGTQGMAVDKEALRTSLTELLLTLHSTTLTIPMVAILPDLEAVDVEDALAQANIMISGDLLLTYEGETLVTLTPDELVTYIGVAPQPEGEDAETIPIFSAEKMATLFDTIDSQVGTPGVNATLTMDLEAAEPYPLKVVEGIDGEGLDRESTAAALTQAAMGLTSRTAEVVLMPVEPEITTEDIQALGITDLLGDYRTTPYTGSKARQQNVRLATSLCSGTFLAPGEEFDTDERLGIRNAANGWALAPGIVGPGELEDVYGGGICQVSTTLWNAVLLAGLKITERYNHSIFINHYPDGRDATVTAGGKNMRFVNDTDHYIFIYGWSTGINTRFWIWGADDGREVQPIKFSGFSFGTPYTTETRINTSLPLGATEEIFSGQTARSCSVTRTITYSDGTTKTEVFKSYYPMMPKVVETNPIPVTTTTVAPSTTTTTTSSSTTSTTD